MELTDIQVALIRLWAHADWHHLAQQLSSDGRPKAPSPIAAPIRSDDLARLVLQADCWHADQHGIWAGGQTATSCTHFVSWRTVWEWLAGWPKRDRRTALKTLAEFDVVTAVRTDEQPQRYAPEADRQAARDRRAVRLERGGYRTITQSRLTLQGLIDRHLDPRTDIDTHALVSLRRLVNAGGAA